MHLRDGSIGRVATLNCSENHRRPPACGGRRDRIAGPRCDRGTHPGIKWLIVDGSTINSVDSTGAAILEALSEDPRARGIRLGFANLRTDVRALLDRSGVQAALGDGALLPTLKSAVDSWVSGGFAE